MPYPWSAGNVLTATDLNSSIAAKYDNAPAINAQTGTTYTFVLTDATAGKTITASNASASTYTVPPQSSVAFSAGALLRVTNLGAGVVTFAAGVGVTVTNTAGTLSQYQTATLVRTGSDAWTVITAASDSMTLLNPGGTALSGTSVVISSIPATYRDLLVIGNAVRPVTAGTQFRCRPNALTSTYSQQYVSTYGTAIFNNIPSGISVGQSGNGINNVAEANQLSILISDYAGAQFKNFRTLASYNDSVSGTISESGFGFLNATAAITSLTFLMSSGNFTSGTVYVYGVK